MDTNKFLTIQDGNAAVLVNLDELIYLSFDGSSLYLEFKNKVMLNLENDVEWQAKIVDEIFKKIKSTT